MRETLLLIDGHALVFRAFFAMPALTNSRGEMTNAVFGFTSMLLKVLGECDPHYAIAAFDPPGPTFRHEEFAEYKAQRPPAPDEVRRQMPLCKQVVEALGIPIVEVPGYEADDVIGTLSRLAEERGLDVIILTGDLDSLQLVTEHVRAYTSRRGITDTIIYDLERVRERYGFEPPLVADFKALQGDASDNIPGVPGIGEKTAKQLVAEHGDLERILAAVPAMKEGRVKRALSENGDQARHSRRMATIVCDLPIELDLEACRFGGFDRDRVVALFDELEFRSLVPRLPGSGFYGGDRAAAVSAQAALPLTLHDATQSPVHIATDAAQVAEHVARLRAAGAVAVRTVVEEPARRGRVVGVALAPLEGDGAAVYLPVHHESAGLDREALRPLEELLADPVVRKTAYDWKREILAWRGRSVDAVGVDVDLMLVAYLVNTRARVPALPLLVEETCGISLATEEALLGSGRSARTLVSLPVDEAAEYFGRWAASLGPLRRALLARLEEASMRRLHDEMELPLVPVLAEMELCGIAVDGSALTTMSRELSQRIAALETEVQEVAGYTFNLGSTQQLARFLYDDLGLASGRRTKTGRSTDADSLESLRSEHPAVDLVLEWRQLTKLRGTYVDALPALVEPDGRVHTSFHQTVAATGRLSSSDPNLQNVPVRGEWGRRVRAAFVPEAAGHVLLSADYSQIELRVLAHVTGEPGLVEAFSRREDIHATTAARIYGVPPSAVTREQRRVAKVVNFGVVYGLSDFGLSRDTGMPQEEAREYIDVYFATFDRVAAYLEQIRQFARQWGYVETLFGRRRYIPDMAAANRQIRSAAERMAVNMPIQGTAADIMKLAMIRADQALRDRGLHTRLLLQVHDELVLEMPESEMSELPTLVREAMSGAAELIVPLDVDVKVGKNWAEMTPLSA